MTGGWRQWRRSDLDALTIICRELGMERVHLACVLNMESGFDPSARNPTSSATGLIQWMAPYPGAISRDQLVSLGVVGQLPLLRNWFGRHRGKLARLSDVYSAVALPIGVGAPADAILAGAIGPRAWAYKANPSWDPLGTGRITPDSLAICARASVNRRHNDFYRAWTGEESPYPHPTLALERIGVQSLDEVKAWQASRGLKADGIIGPKTGLRVAVELRAQEGW